MKTFITLILSFLTLNIATAQLKSSNYYTEHYPTGIVKALYTFEKNGVKVNLFHPNGTLSEAGHFRNNKRHKVWMRWNQEGQKISMAKFKNGKKKGTWLVWHSNGKILLEIDYKNDRVADSRQWDKHGNYIQNESFAKHR